MSECQLNYTATDFKSSQEVRWCPGCGDHAVLSSVQRAMAQCNIKKEDYAIISGIGCSSRFPYYMANYGMHGIHGRASAIASGVKTANPNLTVIQISGDGDALAIGGNHFIHLVRRNIDITMILFNNEIYGLTKGQYSPTSKFGAKTKSSPYGTIETPFIPGELVLGAQGKFFARSIDNNIQLTQDAVYQSINFKGTSVIEVLQNCVIFNDKTFAYLTDREHKADRQLILKHGEKMIFGKNNDKGIVLDGFELKVVIIGQDGYTLDDILVHDAKNPNSYIHNLLIKMAAPDFPVALGVIRAVDAPTYDDLLYKQIDDVKATSKIKNVSDLLRAGNTWDVK